VGLFSLESLVSISRETASESKIQPTTGSPDFIQRFAFLSIPLLNTCMDLLNFVDQIRDERLSSNIDILINLCF
jgi:hypothetical protein